MPKVWTFTDPDTGRKLRFRGEEPTEEQIDAEFAKLKSKPTETEDQGGGILSKAKETVFPMSTEAKRSGSGLLKQNLLAGADILSIPARAFDATTKKVGKVLDVGAEAITGKRPGFEAGAPGFRKAVSEKVPEGPLRENVKFGLEVATDPSTYIGAGAARKAFTAPGKQALKDVAEETAKRSSLLSKAGGKVEDIGKSSLRSGMKIKDVTAKRAGRTVESGAKRIVDNISKYNVEGSFDDIAKKSTKEISLAKQAADDVIAKASDDVLSKTVDVEEVILDFMEKAQAEQLDEFFGEGERAAKIASEMFEALEKRGLAGVVDMTKANRAKKLIGKKAFKKGVLQISEDPVRDRVKEFLNLKIRDEMEKVIPEIRQHNQKIHDLILVRQASEEAAKRTKNRDIFRLTEKGLLLGSGGAAIAGEPTTAIAAAGLALASKAAGKGRGASALIKAGKGISRTNPARLKAGAGTLGLGLTQKKRSELER